MNVRDAKFLADLHDVLVLAGCGTDHEVVRTNVVAILVLARINERLEINENFVAVPVGIKRMHLQLVGLGVAELGSPSLLLQLLVEKMEPVHERRLVQRVLIRKDTGLKDHRDTDFFLA